MASDFTWRTPYESDMAAYIKEKLRWLRERELIFWSFSIDGRLSSPAFRHWQGKR
jgi:hypothetical protein